MAFTGMGRHGGGGGGGGGGSGSVGGAFRSYIVIDDVVHAGVASDREVHVYKRERDRNPSNDLYLSADAFRNVTQVTAFLQFAGCNPDAMSPPAVCIAVKSLRGQFQMLMDSQKYLPMQAEQNNPAKLDLVVKVQNTLQFLSGIIRRYDTHCGRVRNSQEMARKIAVMRPGDVVLSYSNVSMACLPFLDVNLAIFKMSVGIMNVFDTSAAEDGGAVGDATIQVMPKHGTLQVLEQVARGPDNDDLSVVSFDGRAARAPVELDMDVVKQKVYTALMTEVLRQRFSVTSSSSGGVSATPELSAVSTLVFFAFVIPDVSDGGCHPAAEVGTSTHAAAATATVASGMPGAKAHGGHGAATALAELDQAAAESKVPEKEEKFPQDDNDTGSRDSDSKGMMGPADNMLHTS